MRPTRPDLHVLAWTRRDDRPRELAAALGGEARIVFTPRLAAHTALLPLRYLTCAAITVAHLARRRPRRLIVVNPPLWPAVIAAAYCRLTGGAYLLDSHPGGFGAQGHHLEGRLQRLHRALVRRARGVLVSTSDWVDVVRSWGGAGTVVHEPASSDDPRVRPPAPRGRPVALFVCIFAPDEPVADVLAAARRAPGVHWRITGDPGRAAPGLLENLPDNVELTGYLGPVEYRRALLDADVVVALTTEPTSVMRAAYEAVYALRPLVISDTPAGRETFPDAAATPNDPGSIAGTVVAVTSAVTGDPDAAVDHAATARRRAVDRWHHQLDDLARLVDGAAPHPPRAERREAIEVGR